MNPKKTLFKDNEHGGPGGARKGLYFLGVKYIFLKKYFSALLLTLKDNKDESSIGAV